MIKFNEQEKIDSVNGALALRPQINEIVDEICERGYSNICWLGVGGTWASAMQATVHMKEMSAIETWAENAAEYLTTGNKRITKDTVVIISSVSGNTKEVVDAIKKIKNEESIFIKICANFCIKSGFSQLCRSLFGALEKRCF